MAVVMLEELYLQESRIKMERGSSLYPYRSYPFCGGNVGLMERKETKL